VTRPDLKSPNLRWVLLSELPLAARSVGSAFWPEESPPVRFVRALAVMARARHLTTTELGPIVGLVPSSSAFRRPLTWVTTGAAVAVLALRRKWLVATFSVLLLQVTDTVMHSRASPQFQVVNLARNCYSPSPARVATLVRSGLREADRHAATLTLWVRSSEVDLLDAYRAMGFELTGRVRRRQRQEGWELLRRPRSSART
jgi:hypothetical protein